LGLPAARLTDLHICPAATGPVPHVGGPIVSPGAPTVLIGELPAARLGDIVTCAGPPSAVIKGSASVLISGQPAARMTDNTAHGGVIVGGSPTVLIGDAGSSGGDGSGGGSSGGGSGRGRGSAFVAGGGAATGAGAGSAPRITALTPEQAQAWFNRFRNDTSIPWNYPNDCCYARAEIMAGQLRAAGVPVGKAWNYAPADGSLRVDTPNDPSGHVEWGYHVAPTVPVRGADGQVRNMVIDPSISDRPLSPQAWAALQQQPRATLVQTSSAPYYRTPDGSRTTPAPPPSEIQSTFAEHRANRAANWARH
jgi:uncharacterized Zn-binding protein involved in type VI secretion